MNIVTVETSNNTITVGVNASKERATDAGTCGGIEILNPLF